jgi:hypothetical protein
VKTSNFIAALAADPARRGMAPGRSLALALALGAFVSAAFFFSMIGARHDFGAAIQTMRFDWKFVDTVSFAVATGALAWRLLRPDAHAGWLALGLATPIVALGGSVAMELMMTPPDHWVAKLVGTNAMHCLTLIPILSLAPLAAALVAMRAGAPARPSLAGAAAGLVSAGLAATIYATNCTDDSPLFVATWYTLGTIVVAFVGALVGDRALRW